MPPSISRAGAGCLHHGARASPAGEFRTFGHDHPKLRRDHIQPLRSVFPDHRHARPGSTGTRCPPAPASPRSAAGAPAVRHGSRDAWQRCPSAVQDPASPPALFFGDRLLDGFEAQLQLFLRQALGAGAEMHASELAAADDATGHSVPAGCPAQLIAASCSDITVSTNARNASMPSGRLCMSSWRIRHATNPTRQPTV